MRPPVLALLAVLATAAPAAADSITVNVHDADGGAALAASVAAVGSSTVGGAASGTGQAVLDGLAAGNYTVTAALPGYKVARQADVATGTTVNLTLTRSA